LFLSLQTILYPEPWVPFNTNDLGNLFISISSTVSYTSNNSFKYCFPIFSFTISRTLYLSALTVAFESCQYNFNHCIFSLNSLGVSKLTSLFIFLFLLFLIIFFLFLIFLYC